MSFEITVLNEQETLAVGRRFAKILRGSDFVGLSGDLGFGKTTFTRGIGEGLGLSQRITSPTYLTARIYREADVWLVHCDLYRTDDPGYLEEIGVLDYLDDGAIVVVEWAEKADLRSLGPIFMVEFLPLEADCSRALKFSLSFDDVELESRLRLFAQDGHSLGISGEEVTKWIGSP